MSHAEVLLPQLLKAVVIDMPESPAQKLLADAFMRYTTSSEGDSLDELLGLTSGARERTRTTVRRNLRNAHLRQAAGCDGSKLNAEMLYRKIRRFESTTWTRWRELETPPETADEFQWHIFFARKLNDRPLPGERMLRNILSQHPVANGNEMLITFPSPRRNIATI